MPGHQSWGERTFTLLSSMPSSTKPPTSAHNAASTAAVGAAACRRQPAVFDLMDELLEAFEADALHVGMDEVFLLGSDQCPRAGARIGRAVREGRQRHARALAESGAEMLIWGDASLTPAR